MSGTRTRLCVHSVGHQRLERRASRVDDRAGWIASTLACMYVLSLVVYAD